jgi:hypothetical protein
MLQRLRRRQKLNLTSSRWAAYATAGAATAIAGVHSAEADIHYSGVLNQPFNDTNPAPDVAVIHTFSFGGGAIFKLDHNLGANNDGFAGFSIHGPVSGMFAGSKAVMAHTSMGAAVTYKYPFKLGAGANIAAQPFLANNPGSFATLAFGPAAGNSLWGSPGTGFIGFKFNNGSGVEYGWVRLTMNGTTGNSFTLVDYAWGDHGTPIVTGQIPEAGSLGLLALGAAGLLAWRRQRAKAPQE